MTEQKEVFEGFKHEITAQLFHSEKEIKDLSKENKKYESYYIESIRSLDLKKRQIKDLRRFSRDVNATIKEQVEEIKKMPFVKEVKLTTKGISVDVGQVNISYRDKDIYIGDFTILITPDGVEVRNRNPIIAIDNEYDEEFECEHPHMQDGDICYGEERKQKINEYFAKFQLKQLVYMVYLFLKTYSERDKYYSISYWTQDAKRKERKQKIKINKEE